MNPPASEEQVAQVEAYVHAALPTPFRAFLLASNGGQPERNEFPIEQASNRSGVRLFYSIGISDTDDLIREYDKFRGRVGIDWLLPVAEDSFGNRIALAISGPQYGAVFFWDHELYQPEPEFDGIYQISDRFDQFLSLLSPAVDHDPATAEGQQQDEDEDGREGWIDPDFLREQQERGNMR